MKSSMMKKFKSILGLLKVLPSEQACIKHFEKLRWNGIIISPYDPNSKVYKCANNRYKCKNTGKYFNVKTGTVFESSKIPLRDWFYVLYIFVNHKEGISSHQLARDMKITQKSTWFMLHRLRLGFECPIFKTMLKGIVEMNETFIGGKNKNRHWDKKAPRCQGRNWKDKIPVWGAIERGGNLIVKAVPNTQRKTLEKVIRENIKEGSTVNTDEYKVYNNLHKWFKHQRINHSAKQYAKGDVSVNAIESFWNFPKRGIYGTYYHISRKHAQKYMDEFALRFNARKYNGEDRFNLVLSSVVGKRLTYQQLIK